MYVLEIQGTDRKLAKEMNVAPRTLSRILTYDLGLHAFKRCTGQGCTMRKSEKLLRLYGKGKS